MSFFFLSSPLTHSFALTRDSASPHATRLIFMIFPLFVFSSLALKKISLFISLLSSFLYQFLASLYYPLPQISARYWHYNLKEAILAAKETNSETIYFSDTAESFLPFFLLYFPYPVPNTSNIIAKIAPFASPSFIGSS